MSALRSLDITGQKYGRLTVISQAPSKKFGRATRAMFICLCECGNEIITRSDALRSGGSRSCGCLSIDTSRKKTIDETGKRYGRLTILGQAEKKKGAYCTEWICQCDCGNKTQVRGTDLRSGKITGCGCLIRKTESEFVIEIKNIVGNEYDVLGEYINANTHIRFKHNLCGHEYETKPNNFIQGRRCPKCAVEVKRSKYPINRKISRNIRSRIIHVLQGRKKSAPTLRLLGCSAEYLRRYLEDLFIDGMTWDNYGRHNGWEVDHIRPCASFDLSDPLQQRECFNYTNLQPMWAEENTRKHSWWNGIHYRSDTLAIKIS